MGWCNRIGDPEAVLPAHPSWDVVAFSRRGGVDLGALGDRGEAGPSPCPDVWDFNSQGALLVALPALAENVPSTTKSWVCSAKKEEI